MHFLSKMGDIPASYVSLPEGNLPRQIAWPSGLLFSYFAWCRIFSSRGLDNQNAVTDLSCWWLAYQKANSAGNGQPLLGDLWNISKKQELVNYHIGLAWDGMKGWRADGMIGCFVLYTLDDGRNGRNVRNFEKNPR